MAKKTWGESWSRLRDAFELLIDTNLHLRESEWLRETVMVAWEKVQTESAVNGLRLPAITCSRSLLRGRMLRCPSRSISGRY